MGLEVYAVLASCLVPPLAGGYLLRKAGCGWGRVAFGGLMCFAIAWVPLFFLFAFCRRHGWDFDTIVLALPLLEAAVFAYLVWNYKDGPPPPPDPATVERERRNTNRTIWRVVLGMFLTGIGGVIAKAFLN
ncbi:MAG: hypothetical protein HQL42_04045 [Alphaproteobacteria bacterium]|nr:hypothetical protein [Alphaproteobacteria bacterium]